MAYAAVISLKHNIERLRTSSHISIVPNSSPEIIQFLYGEVVSLQKVLNELDSSSSNSRTERVNALDGRIKEAVWELEDVLESHLLNQCLGEEIHLLPFSLDLQQLKHHVDSFTQKVNKMKEEYTHELHCPLPEQIDVVRSRIAFDGTESKMVGLSGKYIEIRSRITERSSPRSKRSGPITVSFLGMAGIGKTHLAKKLFKDPLISSVFQKCVFVTIGPKYHLECILRDIIKQLDPDIDEKMLMEGEASTLARLRRTTYRSLMAQRYLIVLDDVWETDIWYKLIPLFPDDSYGNRVLVTTRILKVADTSASLGSRYEIRLLDKKESWDLLCEKVFGENQFCPSELEKAGKKIAEKCEGLPLTIVTVAHILSKAPKTQEYWEKVADKQNSVFTDAYDQMFEVLYPSYNYLPQYLKPCFLYMGVFLQNCEIPLPKLTSLWSAEGFLDTEACGTSEASDCFLELSYRSLVMVQKERYSDGMKTFSLISPFWYMCNKEATRNKFFHGLNTLADGSAERIEGQRRLCIRNNVLFGIKDVYDTIKSISAVRSLLCTGPYHQYSVPICLGLRLLRVLNALTIRFYNLPMEAFNLLHLTYFALTFNGKLPASISKLRNLQYLIVHEHLSIIKSAGSSSYLPIEIWDMKELHHLEVMGSNIPDPCEKTNLPKLSTLLNVSPQSCTKDVFEKIPNLLKLGIRVELTPDSAEPLSFFDHISHLLRLKKLKCDILNPKIMSKVVVLPARPSIFPSSLVKLTLSGLGYPWEEMSKISSLPKLKMLKLRCYAFQGPTWVVRENEFRQLEFLLIEDTDLAYWQFQDYFGLNELKSFSIKHCYKLKEIPLKFGEALERIELVDCTPIALKRAEELREILEQQHPVDLSIQSSWNDNSIKS